MIYFLETTICIYWSLGIIDTLKLRSIIMSKNEVLELALHLKADEKFLIIDALLKSLDKPDKNIDDVWEDEAISRLKAYDEGKLETVSEEEFFNYAS